MNLSEQIVFIIEIIGTVAFALSGAMVAIEKKLDLFGVLMLGVTTAVCGGMVRDLLLGITPPLMFENPVYVFTAVISSVALFLIVRWKKDFLTSKFAPLYKQVLNILDAIGLGAFTVIGVNTAYEAGFGEKEFLMITVGTLTGVGGGLLRDVMAMQTPAIFVKHIYAVASIGGASLCVLLSGVMSMNAAMVTGAVAVIVIRMLSTYFEWDLPKAIN